MKKTLLLLLLATVALPAFAATKFGVPAPWVKIGDAGEGNDPTFGGGHNIVASGNEVYVAYSSDDTSYACAPYAACDLQIWVARSLDGGVTFEHVVLVARSLTVEWNGAQLAIGPDPTNPGGRRLHVVWGDIAGGSDGAANIMYAYAPLDPHLGAFSAPVPVNGAVPAAAYARNIAADPLGGVHVVFSGSDPVTGNYGIFYSQSSDGGTTFSEVATYVGRPNSDGQDPAIAADTQGDVFIVARAYPGMGYYRRLAGEATFTGPVILSGIVNDEPSIAAFDANHVYLSGIIYAGGLQTPGVASTSRGGLNPSDWTNHQLSTTMMTYGDVKPIAVDCTGAVGVAWLTSDASYRPTIYFSRSTNAGSTWSAPAAAFTFKSGDDVRDVNLGFNASGKALLDVSRNSTIAFTMEN